MITNFEDHTEDLTDIEKEYLPQIEQCLKKFLEWGEFELDVHGNKYPYPVKQNKLCEQINNELISLNGLFCSLRLNTVRLRKYFNYFRTNGILAIVATSEGCYITKDKEEIQRQIKSLKERARQINRAAVGLEKFL